MDLHAAAAAGDLAELSAQLSSKRNKVDVIQKETAMFGERIVGVSNATPLILAVGNGHLEAARVLLEAGANVNHAASEGYTPLILAAMLGDIPMIRLLAERGAHLDARTQLGDQPLLAALNLDRWEAAHVLLDLGASPGQSGAFGFTPLARSVEYWKWSVEPRDPEKQSQLARLIGKGEETLDLETSERAANSLAMVQRLIELGADPSAPGNFQSETALHIAAAAASTEMARLLISHGADIKRSDAFGAVPLMVATKRPDMTKLLLESGADPERTDGFNRTALFHAANARNREVLKILIEAGARTDTVDLEGATVLDILAREGDSELHRFLVGLGGGRVSPESAQLLRDKELKQACISGDLHRLRELIAEGANPNAKPSDGWHPLMNAARGGHAEIVRELLSAGAKVNAHGIYDQTALHAGAESGSRPVIEALIGAGAKLDGLTDRGTYPIDPWTPLMIAAQSGSLGAVEALVEAGANIDVKSKLKKTTLLIVAEHGHPAVAQYLLDRGAKLSPATAVLLEPLEFAGRMKQKVFKEIVGVVRKLSGAARLKSPRLDHAVLFDLKKTAPAQKVLAEFLSNAGAEAKPQSSFFTEKAAGRAIHYFLEEHQNEILKLGAYPVYYSNLHGDKLALVPTTNPCAVVAALGPAPKGTPAMIEWLQKLEKETAWVLRGSSYDTLMLQFTKPIKDREALAKKLFTLRSDERGVVVNGEDHLTDTIKELADKLKGKRPVVRLWWD